MLLLSFIMLAFLLGVLSVVLFNAFTAPMLKKAPLPTSVPRVSLLVPARNEERNIATCLQGLTQQAYDDLEILVLNDHSEDRTAEMIQPFCDRDSRVHLLKGQPLPAGWTGKNWACYQLSQAATGEIFIFTDADNRHTPHAVRNTVGWMEKLGLSLFSAFPQQITRSLAEKLVIPVIDLFVYALLPLWGTYYLRSTFFAAANGQWIALTREAYEALGGHAAVRHEVVEDVELSRLAKRQGRRILTSAGTGIVSGRMYHCAREVWEGFSKNLFGLTAHQTIPFFMILAGFLLAFILPYFLVWFPATRVWAGIAIAANLLIRGILALKYKHPLFTSVMLHPIGVGFTILIALNSFVQVKWGKIRWKGREIQLR